MSESYKILKRAHNTSKEFFYSISSWGTKIVINIIRKQFSFQLWKIETEPSMTLNIGEKMSFYIRNYSSVTLTIKRLFSIFLSQEIKPSTD